MAKAQSIVKPGKPVVELSLPRRIWRWFRSMRTAIVLVLVLAVGSIIGTLLPQKSLDESAVQAFNQQNPSIGKLFDLLGFFNVYYSWWYIVILVMLFISLIACIIPRTSTYIKKFTQPNKNPTSEAFIINLKNKAGFAISLPANEIIERATQVLKSRKYIIREIPGKKNQIYAERGRLGGFGSLLFHYMFLVLVIGVVFGRTTGFGGYANIIEGESFTENRFNYARFTPGPFFRDNGHTNFKIMLDDFEVKYHPSGQPADFISKVRIYDNDGKLIEKKDIRVNNKFVYKGIKAYQSSYGWAPHVTVYKDGDKIYDQSSVFYGSSQNVVSNELRPDGKLTMEAFFVPDIRTNESGGYAPGSLELKNPALYIKANIIDENGKTKTLFDSDKSGIINLNEKKELGGGYIVEFPQVKEWTGLQIIKDDGVPIVYVSFFLGIIGLYITFYLSHRRIWVLIEKDNKGKNKLLIGGMTEKNQGAFDSEFSRISENIKVKLLEG